MNISPLTEPLGKRDQATKDGSLPKSAFAPDRLQFFQRIAEGQAGDRRAAAVAEAHLKAFAGRMSHAMEALKVAHNGSALAYLEIGLRDYEAAMKTLSEATKA